jgi:hypothetical protein
MKPHPHGHSHESHGHGTHEHPAPGDVSSDASAHPLTPRHAHAGGHDGTLGMGLLMTSSFSRVLGALGLITLLWLAVAWAVMYLD